MSAPFLMPTWVMNASRGSATRRAPIITADLRIRRLNAARTTFVWIVNTIVLLTAWVLTRACSHFSWTPRLIKLFLLLVWRLNRRALYCLILALILVTTADRIIMCVHHWFLYIFESWVLVVLSLRKQISLRTSWHYTQVKEVLLSLHFTNLGFRKFICWSDFWLLVSILNS